MRQRQEVSVSQRGQSCSVFSGGSVGQSGLVLDGLRMFIWPIWPICAFRLCLWNQQAAVSSLRGALGTATIVMTETIGGRYQGGRRYNLELFGSCIVFYHILSKYVTIVLLYQWLETMFERTFCGNDVWILSPPATSLDESWKGDDGDDHLSHLDWWSPVRCHVAEKPSFSHCVFIVPVCRLKTDCQRAPLPMIYWDIRGSQKARILLKRGSTQCTSMPKKRRHFGGDSPVAQWCEHEPTIRGSFFHRLK